MTPPLTVEQLLKNARDKIADPKHWTQGKMAINRFGFDVPPESPNAACFCSVGAVRAANTGNQPELGREALERLTLTADHLFGCGIISVNDLKGHASALKVFDKAINDVRRN